MMSENHYSSHSCLSQSMEAMAALVAHRHLAKETEPSRSNKFIMSSPFRSVLLYMFVTVLRSHSGSILLSSER